MTDQAPAATPTPLEHVRRHRKPLKNVNAEVKAQMSPLNRVALFITTYVGTMGFFIIIFLWTLLWLAWNMFAPAKLRFDPATGFVLYLFLCNVIQILLMPLIMVGQNLQGAHSEARAENDLEINIKAEKEIEVILEHLEYQNRMIIAMVQKLGCELEAGHKAEKAQA
ncbi:MAG TPA: DUF1003 domain-containing protein [Caulobacteraceae bacterium]|jgi:uncharacterized membrane protein|nr:DUF1003 domain-containing protein [Caulobacteraceae bacterium]